MEEAKEWRGHYTELDKEEDEEKEDEGGGERRRKRDSWLAGTETTVTLKVTRGW